MERGSEGWNRRRGGEGEGIEWNRMGEEGGVSDGGEDRRGWDEDGRGEERERKLKGGLREG